MKQLFPSVQIWHIVLSLVLMLISLPIVTAIMTPPLPTIEYTILNKMVEAPARNEGSRSTYIFLVKDNTTNETSTREVTIKTYMMYEPNQQITMYAERHEPWKQVMFWEMTIILVIGAFYFFFGEMYKEFKYNRRYHREK